MLRCTLTGLTGREAGQDSAGRERTTRMPTDAMATRLAMRYAVATGRPTLYFSADMKAYQASVALAALITGCSPTEVDQKVQAGGPERKQIVDALTPCQVVFKFGAITKEAVRLELDGYRELYDAYPDLVVVDQMPTDPAACAYIDYQLADLDIARFTID